jgi:hypothetical protein
MNTSRVGVALMSRQNIAGHPTNRFAAHSRPPRVGRCLERREMFIDSATAASVHPASIS